jgi:2'-5' RNA ligase
MRLFVAINFNENTCARLRTLRDEVRSTSRSGRFSQSENLHLTMAFIGETSPKKLDRIKMILETVSFMPFEVTIERLGTFSRGTLWWAGLREDKPLMNLQYEIEFKFAHCGFEMPGGQYIPHITLGREVMTDTKPWQIEPFRDTVTKIDLMKSERVGGKLIYTTIYSRNAEDGEGGGNGSGR